jgi:carbonic anhydrase/acetyltransferase-like protein (isoleucine patch superfamily)
VASLAYRANGCDILVVQPASKVGFFQCSWVPYQYSIVSTVSYWTSPDFSQAAFVAPNAVVLGSVNIAAGASLWYGAVVRGDVERIEIGECTNIQDGAILHGDPGLPTILEDHITIGHRAVVHSAHIERGSLIGIGSIILNGVRVGHSSIIGAGAVVTKDIPPFSLVVGIPAKIVRQLTETETTELIEQAEKYHKLALVHAGKGTDIGFR